MSATESFPKRVSKKWGTEIWYANTDKYCLKRLEIQPGWQCSLHRHPVKDETFVVKSGMVFIELDGRTWIADIDEAIHVPPMTWHRFGSHDWAEIVEVSTHHSDDDVERLEESRLISAAAQSGVPSSISSHPISASS